MNCLRIDQIYLYLEGELSAAEISAVEKHLHSCPLCQNAMEERRLLLKAADNIPLMDPPPLFTQQVMSRILLQRISLRAAVLAVTSAFTSAAALLMTLFLLSGQSVANMLVGLNQSTMAVVRNIVVGGAKVIKVVALVFKLIYQFSEFIGEGLGHLTGILSPEFQVMIISVTLLSTMFLYLVVKRKISTGDKI
jgi:anti-sigma factor RsiW